MKRMRLAQSLLLVMSKQLLDLLKVPLESAGAVVANVGDEFCDVLQYAIQFISL